MATDPFSTIVSAAAALAPRLTVDALDEQELVPAMLSEVRSFCAEFVNGERIDRDGRLSSALLAAVAERGWFGLTVPSDYDGAGLSLAAATRVVSELAAHDGSLGTCVGLHSGLALHALLHAAAPELRQRYLPEIAAGRVIAAFAATEPNAGSDISAVRTRLAEVDGRLVLNGAKCYVTNGGLCDLVTVLAQSPGLGGARAGHTLVLVDPKWPGVTRSREEHKMGLRGSSTLTLTFEDVSIPHDHVLGEVSQGLQHAHAALCWGRTFMAAGCLGNARAAWLIAREHTAVRKQFGRSLDRFQLVRERLANDQARLHAIESALRLVCALSDTAQGDLAMASSMLKVLASDGAWQIIDDAVQVMGGAGYTEDSGVARRLRDVRVTRIFEGANDVLRVSLASAALAWPAASLLDVDLGLKVPAALSPQAEQLETSLNELGQTVRTLKKQWGFRLFEEQAIAVELADAMIALFASVAVLARACEEAEHADPKLALAQLSLAYQLERASEHLARARSPRDRAQLRWIAELTADPQQ